MSNFVVKQNATSAADWLLDPIELAAVFNERTKIIILNNPHNPVGKVYTRYALPYNMCGSVYTSN